MGYTAILAVLPSYRASFVEATKEQLAPNSITFIAGDVHLVPSVRTDRVLPDRLLENHALFGRRLLWQSGAIRLGLGRETLVVDLNPRSVTAWILLFARRLLGRRTVAWGHIHPRAGATAPTAPLRGLMMRIADGVICYTYSDQEELRTKAPEVEAWVAPNGLYRAEQLACGSAGPEALERDAVVYVGRLEDDKKPLLLIRAFAHLVESDSGGQLRLEMVGDGDARQRCVAEAERLGISKHVRFHGSVGDANALRSIYSRAICSVSPGYVGLSLTQSLGFGVPMVAAREEPHAPEIELLGDATGYWFESDSVAALAGAIDQARKDAEVWDRRRQDLIELVANRYSADSMARGFIRALRNEAADGR